MDLDVLNNVLLESIEQSNLSHTISRIDGDNELLYVNAAFEKETGYSYDEAVGQNCRFLQGEKTDPETISRIKNQSLR